MNTENSPFAIVADDDTLIRMDAASILEDAGFRVLEAANVEEALVLLETSGESVQLLFTDVEMPPSDLNGFYLARKCSAGWPHIGIIVASGRAQPDDRDMPEGARFVKKPFSADVVYNHLQKILPEGKMPKPLKSNVAKPG